MGTNELIQEGYDLKAAIDRMTERLREINSTLAQVADFGDSKTAHLVADGIAVKIARRENVKWNQERLGTLKDIMGEEQFSELFQPEYKPDGKKVSAYLKFGQFKDGVEWAREVSEGAPSVTYSDTREAQANAA